MFVRRMGVRMRMLQHLARKKQFYPAAMIMETATNGRKQEQAKKDLIHKPTSLPRYTDLLSRVTNFSIIESTLREGEQFANAFFDTATKIAIARALDDFGVWFLSRFFRGATVSLSHSDYYHH